jgi:hypothetical protein
MTPGADLDSAVQDARVRSKRDRDSDGLSYLVFGALLILWGAKGYMEAKLHPYPPPGGVSGPFDSAHFFGSPKDWLLDLAGAVLLISLARLQEIIEWVKRRITYPRTGYVATVGARELEFGHILMMAPVFVIILGAPFSDSPVARHCGLWIVAASFLVSFAGVLRCRRARAPEFLYIAFPAAGFVFWWNFVSWEHFIRGSTLIMASLFTVQGIGFVAIGLIHLFFYLRHNPRTQGDV